MELIPIINNGDIKAVDARVLHSFLEAGTRFNDWIRARIEKYDFVENEDFQAITEKKVTAQGNDSTQTNYIISLDMAKELAMVENNEKGSKQDDISLKSKRKPPPFNQHLPLLLKRKCYSKCLPLFRPKLRNRNQLHERPSEQNR